MPRPRSDNYHRNLIRSANQLIKAGVVSGSAIRPDVLGPEWQPPPETAPAAGKPASAISGSTEEFNRSAYFPLVENFIKSAARTGAVQKWRNYQDVMDKQVVFNDDASGLREQGIIYRPQWRLAYEDCRRVAMINTLLGACHQVYIDDARLHSEHNKELGFVFMMEDRRGQLKRNDEKQARELARNVETMGDRTLEDWRERDRFDEVLGLATADVLAIDKVAYLKTKNRKGQIIDVRYLDPATIYRVDPRKGYKGDTRVKYVQVIDFQVIDTYEADRIILRHRNRMSDVRFRGEGWSPTESCIYELIGMIHALKLNLNRFDNRMPPKKLLSSANDVSDEVKEFFADAWESAYGPGAAYGRVPFVWGVDDLKVHDLGTDTDTLFEKWMQWTARLILSRHGMDEAELGLRLAQGGGLNEPSMDGRARFSRNRRHGAIMKFHQRCIREIYEEDEQKRPLLFTFTGIRDEDKESQLNRAIKQLENFKTLDQILAENDLPPWREQVEEYWQEEPEEERRKLARMGAMIWNDKFLKAYEMLSGGDEQQGEGMDADDGGEDPDGLEYDFENDDEPDPEDDPQSNPEEIEYDEEEAAA